MGNKFITVSVEGVDDKTFSPSITKELNPAYFTSVEDNAAGKGEIQSVERGEKKIYITTETRSEIKDLLAESDSVVGLASAGDGITIDDGVVSVTADTFVTLLTDTVLFDFSSHTIELTTDNGGYGEGWFYLDNSECYMGVDNMYLGMDPGTVAFYNVDNLYLRASDEVTIGLGTGASHITFGASQTVIVDEKVAPTGLEYGADYSATYTNRSLVDKGYVAANYLSPALVSAVSPTSPDTTIKVVIGGVDYYIAAKTTND